MGAFNSGEVGHRRLELHVILEVVDVSSVDQVSPKRVVEEVMFEVNHLVGELSTEEVQ